MVGENHYTNMLLSTSSENSCVKTAEKQLICTQTSSENHNLSVKTDREIVDFWENPLQGTLCFHPMFCVCVQKISRTVQVQQIHEESLLCK